MHSHDNKIQKLLHPAIAIFAAALALFLLGGSSHDLLLRIEGRSLFIWGRDYFLDCMSHPAGLASYISRFLNQFLIMPWIGASIAVVLLAGIGLTVRKAFELDGHLTLFALLPPALLLASDMGLGYGLFTIKTQGWFFMGIVCYLASMLAVLAHRKSGAVSGMLFALIWSGIGYLAFGSYAIIATLCMGILTFGKEGKAKVVRTAIILVAAIAVPWIYSRMYLTIRPQDWIIAGLPALPFSKEYFTCWGPLAILALLTIAAAIHCVTAKKKDISTTVWWSLQASGVILCAAILYGFWFKDTNFMAEMKMRQAIEREDWKEVIRIHDKTAEKFVKADQKVFSKRSAELSSAYSNEQIQQIVQEYNDKFYGPSRLMVIYRNISLARLGTGLDQMFSHKDGGRKQPMPEMIPLSMQGGKEIYLNYGLYNYSYRWCMEDAVEYGWSPESLRYGVMSQIAAGNLGVAEKLLSKLDKTMFHRKWAREQRELIENPEKLKASEYYSFIKQLERPDSRLSNDVTSIESYIMSSFTAQRPEAATPLYDQVALMWAMQTQDIPTFWDSFLRWWDSHRGQEIPRYVQEAAFLYANLDEMEDVNMLNIDKGAKDRFTQFMQYVQKHPVRSETEMRYQYEKSFGKTFYFYYYFIRNLESY